jgi:hypothetical protein
MSRSRCAHHPCRRPVGYQVEALQRAVTTHPQHRAPKRAWATLARRDRRPTTTVPQVVTIVHSQARGRPSRHPVSSRSAAGCAWTQARASATGSAKAWTVACSRVAPGPRPIETPKRSASLVGVVRVARCYAPVHRAVIACTRGPKPPVGMPTGHPARVASPQAGQTTCCH